MSARASPGCVGLPVMWILGHFHLTGLRVNQELASQTPCILLIYSLLLKKWVNARILASLS